MISINLRNIILGLLLVLFLILIITYSSLIFTLKFNKKNFSVRLSIQLLFRIIKINLKLYPPKKKKKKKNKSSLKLVLKVFSDIFDLVKNIKVEELYSDIVFANENPYITVYVNTLINGIYGNIINIFNSKKVHLSIEPKFTENNIKGSVKIHIKFNPYTMLKTVSILIKIARKLKSKDGDNNE